MPVISGSSTDSRGDRLPSVRRWLGAELGRVLTNLLAAGLAGITLHSPPTQAQTPSGKEASSPPSRASGTPAVATERERDAFPERHVWERAPLRIAMGVGPERERTITFPSPMHIGVPPEVAPLLRVQTVGRTTYVTALAPFPRTRVVAEDRASGAVVLLDLSAAPDGTSTSPVEVLIPSVGVEQSLGRADEDDDQAAPVDMVTLTRFAAKQMYAPHRLTGPHPAIRRVTVDPNPLQDLYAGGLVRAVPAAQWRADDLHVTAVVLSNLLPHPLELDPLEVRGRWRAITFQHGRLLAQGSEADSTVVYLVCDRPFDSCR